MVETGGEEKLLTGFKMQPGALVHQSLDDTGVWNVSFSEALTSSKRHRGPGGFATCPRLQKESGRGSTDCTRRCLQLQAAENVVPPPTGLSRL